jgi:hypothetical protein
MNCIAILNTILSKIFLQFIYNLFIYLFIYLSIYLFIYYISGGKIFGYEYNSHVTKIRIAYS